MSQKLKLLILEDNPADVEFIHRELRKAGMEFSSYITDTREQFLEGLEQFIPDVILSDHSLPQFNSIEALRLTKEHDPNVPFLLVTGAVSEEFAVQVIKDGADDYILKNHLMRLPSAISNALKKRAAEKERVRMLEQLLFTNNELNTFLYKATHDLRGPLTSIMGLANLASRDENMPQVGTFIHMISECTTKLDEILVSLIETMAIKNARLSVDPINFREMISKVMQRLEFVPEFAKIHFDIDITTDKPFSSDEKILNSILQNVVENGIKYHNRSIQNPFIRVRISDFEDGVRIEVADNGIGIDPAIQDKIFEMFYRGNDGSKGSGLGLYLVKNGIQRLGGMINLKSAEGAGTTLSIYLPSAKPQA
jgi:signal transduction histidine kinase